MCRWADDDHLWVRQVAVQSQLRQGPATDTALLADVIVPNLGDRTF